MFERHFEPDLEHLSLRGIVAFATRCARRVQSLYRLPENHPRLNAHVSAVDQALMLAEGFVAGRDISPSIAMTIADAARRAAREAYAPLEAASAETRSATRAAHAAAEAVETFSTMPGHGAIAFAAYTATLAIAAAVEPRFAEATEAAVLADLDRLLELAPGQPDSLGDPMDASAAGPLGPLWPAGEPEWHVTRFRLPMYRSVTVARAQKCEE